ncbi:MAG: hypothetical protein HC880_19360 [Bacteroidia bacterium]|nr:hypothetical protein [Bacteroidia bacterium]
MNEEDAILNQDWEKLLSTLEKIVGKKPQDLNAVLFLIGVQELGQGVRVFSKEQKQDLMHIGICRILSSAGFYEFKGRDKDGWPHWNLVKELPYLDLLGQESILKTYVIRYFEEEGIL